MHFEVEATTSGQNADLAAVLERYQDKQTALEQYTKAYRQYCWNVESLEDYRIAPFHILATESRVWNQENHLQHMAVIRQYMTGTDPVFVATNHMAVDLTNAESVQAGVNWWLELTSAGGEGMVVKPLDFPIDNTD